MLVRKLTNIVLLAILDGWGISSPGPGNAISLAKTPNFSGFMASYPHTQLVASGVSVGLPRGEVGNTETGHLNIGAGRIVYQDLVRINMSIADGSFYENQAFNRAVDHALSNNSSLHLMGLVGAGGVHSNLEHLIALIQLAAKKKITKLYIHVFTDGRDSPPNSSLTYIARLKEVIAHEGLGEIASVMGRYWAMDRDQRWDRTAKAYFALTRGDGLYATSVEQAIQTSYSDDKSDEFIEPTLISSDGKTPTALIKDDDAVIFFNFRIDRPRQLSRAFCLDDVSSADLDWGFDPYAVEYEKKHAPEKVQPTVVIHRGEKLKNLLFVTMTEYEKALVEAGAASAFPPEKVVMPLGQVISTNGLKQLRASESEKERFVGFYLNGQIENPLIGEDRLVIPSPDVASYDLKPEMSALELTDQILNKIKTSGEYSFIVVNFANADMVGHTGNIQATIKGVEAIDVCLGKLYKFINTLGGVMLITADHGNAEEMIESQTGLTNTEHSDSSVPFIATGMPFVNKPVMLQSGILADIAPTVLSILGITPPNSMTGKNLLESVMK